MFRNDASCWPLGLKNLGCVNASKVRIYERKTNWLEVHAIWILDVSLGESFMTKV